MFDVGPHSCHIDIKITKKNQVICQVGKGLKRQADHHTGANLVANITEGFQCPEAAPVVMLQVVWMEFFIKVLVRHFDTQKVPVRSGFEPAAVGFFRLFAKGERNVKFPLRQLPDLFQQFFNG